MTTGSRDNLRVAAGVVVSLALHGAVMLPMLVRIATAAESDGLNIEAALESDLPTDDITLGLDDGDPSTLTWVGHRDYVEHLAQLSEVEQAALTETPPPGGEPMAAMQPEETAEIEPIDLPIAEESPPSMVEAPPLPMTLPEHLMLLDLLPKHPLALLREHDALPLTESNTPVEHPDDGEVSEPVDAELSDADPAQPEEAEAVEHSTTRENVEQHPPVQDEAVEQEEGAEAPPNDRAAEVSDRESDPTSIIDISRDQWLHGRPVSGRGIEVLPRGRPFFTPLMRFTLMPRNPRCAIHFDHRGIPMEVEIVRSSGHADVDKSVRDWLFAWRATGDRIDALANTTDRVTVPMRIIIVQGKD